MLSDGWPASSKFCSARGRAKRVAATGRKFQAAEECTDTYVSNSWKSDDTVAGDQFGRLINPRTQIFANVVNIAEGCRMLQS